MAEWIWEQVADLPFETALDAFGGTACIGHLFKLKGKRVVYNDILRFNHIIGLALVENDDVRLGQNDLDFVLGEHEGILYPTFIQDTFGGIYYTDEENAWIDRVVTNIGLLENKYAQSVAFFALFQACVVKRPFNLFHRKNLYIRTSDVKRNFGNKTSWDKPFEEWFCQFVAEANAAVFSNGRQNAALNCDALEVPGEHDLVYIDTPYVSARSGTGVDYYHFYHFLEGLADYQSWPERLDHTKKHLPLRSRPSPWIDKRKIYRAFDRLFARFQESIVVVSYRDDGIPSGSEIIDLLRKYKRDVSEVKRTDYKYVLSTNGSAELLFIAR